MAFFRSSSRPSIIVDLDSINIIHLFLELEKFNVLFSSSNIIYRGFVASSKNKILFTFRGSLNPSPLKEFALFLLIIVFIFRIH